MLKSKFPKTNRIELSDQKVDNIWTFYSNISTLHGAQHLKNENKSYWQRIFWSIVIISALLSTAYIQTLFLQRFIERPLVTSLQRDYYTWNTTFPSFTLCSQRKMNETALQIHLREMNLPRHSMLKLEAFLRVLVNLTMYNLDSLSKFGDFKSPIVMQVIEKLTNKYDYDVLIDSVPSFKLQRTMTELGICDQFNSELSQIFATDFLISDRLPAQKPLFEINYFDTSSHIVLNDLDDSNIHIHGPFELPQYLQKREISGSVSQYKSFTLTATTIVARQNVRALFISHRKCRYVDESDLSHFPSMYAFDLCKIECRIKAIIERCKCVPFFYKKLPHETYCNAKQLLCVELLKDDINEATKSCECYQLCTNVKFGIQGVNSLNWLQNNKLRMELSKPKMRLIREALHSYTDVVAAIGATFCLFLGASILTVVEIIYLGFLHCFKKQFKTE
ncbi:sodium channel protein Nach-like [Sitodiplosis mosellana]|uniref:sodium channel protein Nach-like n=1 Tax=Sitodiplosis mosellana TaxID=263140 RepID=UPI002444CED1|nr:sodium channel protein Nach-like [Sitodiplosis mosellana]